MTISVLYIHHAGAFGGASRSLLEMIRAFPSDAVAPHLITPRGNVAEFAGRQGVPLIVTRGISQLDTTRFGHYRGLRWLLLLRELWLLPFTVAALFKAKARWKTIQIIHVNDVTALLPVIIAKLLFRKPVVVHVRSVLQTSGMPLRRRLLRYVILRYADKIVAIDETVKGNLPSEFAACVIHNGFALDLPATEAPATDLPPALTCPGFKAAMVGNLLPMKGLAEFMEAARLCTAKGLDIHFVIIGDNARKLSGLRGWLLQHLNFARDVRADIENFVQAHALGKHVHLIGFMPNIRDAYERISVLCFPSHLNAAGRPVFEAAFSKVPGIVAIERPPGDTIVDRETGLCVPAGDARALADAIEYFYTHPAERQRMGDAAYALACRNFDVRRNAAEMLDIYRGLAV
ncbi:MAG: glycosyltransferase family 4 protein [Burkholderiales bacterium]